jgi:hypothetical protein
MRGRISVASVFLTLAALGTMDACVPSDPPVNAGTGGTSGSSGTGGVISCGGASGTSTLATWANVRDVIEGSSPPPMGCFGADCHTQGDREPFLLGLNSTPMSDAALYDKLTTYRTVKCGKRVLVKPCAPNDSAFYLAQADRCGDDPADELPQMPFGCLPEFDNCTPADKLEGIRQWIANGARRP